MSDERSQRAGRGRARRSRASRSAARARRSRSERTITSQITSSSSSPASGSSRPIAFAERREPRQVVVRAEERAGEQAHALEDPVAVEHAVIPDRDARLARRRRTRRRCRQSAPPGRTPSVSPFARELDRVVGAVALPALVRDADRVVVELEAVAGRVARAEAAARRARAAARASAARPRSWCMIWLPSVRFGIVEATCAFA